MEEIYRATFEQAAMGIAHVSPDGHWLKANRTYCKIVGYSEAELQKKTFRDITYPDDMEESVSELPRLLSGQSPFWQAEKRYIRKDGSIVWVNLTTSLVRKASGEADFFIASVIDITHRKMIEEERDRALHEVRKSVRTRDEFISIASHELKTPVTAMGIQIDILERTAEKKGQDSLGPSTLLKALKVSQRQLSRLNRLVEDMLDISRIRTNKLQIEKEDVDLGALVQEIVDKMKDQLNSVNCKATVRIETDIVGRWDRSRLEQVVTSLLSNAIKYAPGQSLDVRVGRTVSGNAMLTVEDHGPGISKPDQDRIFERFERAIPHTYVSGLGLGLYIAKQIIELHHGSIRVESELNKGSKFIVELPFCVKELAREKKAG